MTKRLRRHFDPYEATIATELPDMQLSFSSSRSRREETQR